MSRPVVLGVIYSIRFDGSPKIYIGSSVNYKQRKAVHISDLRRDNHHSLHLQRAYAKYGESAMRFAIIEEVHCDLLKREQHWIDHHKSRLYNIQIVANSPLGLVRDDAFRKKRSEAMMGNTLRRGKKMSEEAKKKISSSLRGNSFRRGIAHSDEIKRKISDGLKKAYREGRHKLPDIKISIRNLPTKRS